MYAYQSGAKETTEKKKHINNIYGIVFMCFSPPQGMIQRTHCHPPSPRTITQISLCLNVFFSRINPTPHFHDSFMSMVLQWTSMCPSNMQKYLHGLLRLIRQHLANFGPDLASSSHILLPTLNQAHARD